jgi:hypothetical protein
VLSHFHCCLWVAPYCVLGDASSLDNSQVQPVHLLGRHGFTCGMLCGLVETTDVSFCHYFQARSNKKYPENEEKFLFRIRRYISATPQGRQALCRLTV